MMKKILGQKFGMLTPLGVAAAPTHLSNPRNGYIACLCDCGNESVVRADHLRKGLSQSCGCAAHKPMRTEEQIAASAALKQARRSREQTKRRAAYVPKERKPRTADPRTGAEKRYGLEAGQYDLLLESQGGVCAICKQLEIVATSKTGRRDQLSVDHCHTTGKVRGLLCHLCNRGLGNFRDDIMRLASAMKYLTTH